MEDVLSFFRETQEVFTVYVVEQRFAIGRGLDYFKSFKGKANYLETNSAIRHQISKVRKWIHKSLPDVADLVASTFSFANSYSITEAITILNKVFSVHEHQAAGPEVIDPIIIQEGKIDGKYITQIVTLHEKSVLQPVIIIILTDNDFDRAKRLLSNCPHGINIKLIRNSGESEICKVINTGAENIEEFINSFAQQCFSTCSHTPRKLLLNEEWAGNSIVRSYAPELLKARSCLIMDEKKDIRKNLINTTSILASNIKETPSDADLLKCLYCIAKLMVVFCNDKGNQDIQDAYQTALDVDNPLLLAQVYRYAFFLDQFCISEKMALLEKAEQTFYEHKLEDQAIYCKNNRLIYQFEQEKIIIRDFQSLQDEAIYNVPGLVGLSHILNNTGVAYLMIGNPELAMEFFEKGIKYAKRQERSVQKIALMCNSLITRSYCYEQFDSREYRQLMNLIFDSPGLSQLPFIFSRFAMNVVAVAFKHNKDIGKTLLYSYPIDKLVRTSLQTNLMGSGSLILQMLYLAAHYPEFDLVEKIQVPSELCNIHGIHRNFIVKYGYNPFVFCTWL